MKYLTILLLSGSCFAADYTEALGKVQEAAYIQSGVKGLVSQFTKYSEDEAKRYLNKVGLEKEVAISLVAYQVYKEKKIIIPISNSNKLGIYLDKLELEIKL